MAILGLAAVGLAVSAAVLLVTGYVVGGLAAALITVLVFCMFGGLWFAFPLAHRRLPGPGPCAQASRSIGQLMQRGPPRPRPSSPPGTVITSMPFSCR